MPVNCKVSSEKEIPSALDKCVADGIIKIGTGILTGSALSLILFRRRFWPVTLGVGIGTGMALANCQNKLNSTDVVQEPEQVVTIGIPAFNS